MNVSLSTDDPNNIWMKECKPEELEINRITEEAAEEAAVKGGNKRRKRKQLKRYSRT